MLLKSIRFKITILYIVILSITLTSFSIILYNNVKRGLYKNMEILLKSKAGGISQAIDTYWEASRLEAIESGAVATETLRKRRNINFTTVAQKWVKEESSDPTLLDILVRVFDTDGAIIASSKNTQYFSEIPKKDFLAVLQGNSRLDTISYAHGRMALFVYTTPVFENEKVAYIVQVASPLTSIQIALKNMKVTLFVLFPLTVLVTGIMGLFLAKATLHPVDSMMHTINQIKAENMKMRLKVPGTRDEIQKLAETFNDMLERLEIAFTSQRQLFEDLSHELKTPLTILKGEFEVALKKLRSPEEYQAIVQSTLEETNKIINLAENLLMLARFDSKEVYMEKKRLNLNLLLQGIVNNIKGISELKRLKISFDMSDNVILDGDESQLKTLFLNILDNAVKYTPEDGKIYISLVKDSNCATITIKDTGVGIPEAEMPHIFDRFYRVEKSRSHSGFGLGLSIAKSIVEAHNGTIDLRSKPSSGTTFIIKLPL